MAHAFEGFFMTDWQLADTIFVLDHERGLALTVDAASIITCRSPSVHTVVGRIVATTGVAVVRETSATRVRMVVMVWVFMRQEVGLVRVVVSRLKARKKLGNDDDIFEMII